MTPTRKRFILWDPQDGNPRREEGGAFISDGIVGRVDENNVYLTTYGRFPEGEARSPGDLSVGQSICGVRYSQSGSAGTYDIYRVA